MKKRLLMSIVALMSLSLLSSCAPTTSMTAAWKDQAYQRPVKKVVVLVTVKQQAVRTSIEEEFVNQLKARQVDAVASHTLIPLAQMSDRNFVAAQVKGVGADTTLATKPVGRKTVERQAPGTSLSGYNSTLSEYYGTLGSERYSIREEHVFVETNLYQTDGDKLVWSARAETWVAASDQELTTSFIKVMVDKLASDRLIK